MYAQYGAVYAQYGAVYAQYGAVYARRTGEYAPFQRNMLEKCFFLIMLSLCSKRPIMPKEMLA